MEKKKHLKAYDTSKVSRLDRQRGRVLGFSFTLKSGYRYQKKEKFEEKKPRPEVFGKSGVDNWAQQKGIGVYI
jgi:hypothetical protein